jgi:hypothetical protein
MAKKELNERDPKYRDALADTWHLIKYSLNRAENNIGLSLNTLDDEYIKGRRNNIQEVNRILSSIESKYNLSKSELRRKGGSNE